MKTRQGPRWASAVFFFLDKYAAGLMVPKNT